MKKIIIVLFVFLFLSIFISSRNCFAIDSDSITLVDVSRNSSQGNYTSGIFQTKGYQTIRGIFTGTGTTLPATLPDLEITWSNDGTDFQSIGESNVPALNWNTPITLIDINEPIRGKFVRITTTAGSCASYNLFVYLSRDVTINHAETGDTGIYLLGTGGAAQIIARNRYRKYLRIENIGTNTDVYIGFNANVGSKTSSSTLGIRLVPIGSATGGLTSTWTSDFAAGVYTGIIHACLGSSTGTGLIQYAEHH